MTIEGFVSRLHCEFARCESKSMLSLAAHSSTIESRLDGDSAADCIQTLSYNTCSVTSVTIKFSVVKLITILIMMISVQKS